MGLQGIQTALAAMRAARARSEVAAHNAANASTEGYSRQKVDLSAVGGVAVPAVHSVPPDPAVGTGVRADGPRRVVDRFIDHRVRDAAGEAGFSSRRAEVLDRVAALVEEPSDSGLAAALDRFFSAWDTLALTPELMAARRTVVEAGAGVADQLREAAGAMDRLWSGTVDQIRAVVAEINSLSTRLAEVNGSLRVALGAGRTAPDLEDTRDMIAGRLARLIGGTATVKADGTVEVVGAGVPLVTGTRADTVSVSAGLTPPVVLVWDRTGSPVVAPAGGELGGLLETVNVDIPQVRADLDNLAAQLVSQVNTLTGGGEDYYGAPGGPFFDPGGTTAVTIAVDPAVVADPNLVAAANPGGAPYGGDVAAAVAALADTPGGPGATHRAMVSALGVVVSAAEAARDHDETAHQRMLDLRDAVSGVDRDSELVELTDAEHAWAAAARVLNTFDEMLDVLINRTGVVGR